MDSRIESARAEAEFYKLELERARRTIDEIGGLMLIDTAQRFSPCNFDALREQGLSKIVLAVGEYQRWQVATGRISNPRYGRRGLSTFGSPASYTFTAELEHGLRFMIEADTPLELLRRKRLILRMDRFLRLESKARNTVFRTRYFELSVRLDSPYAYWAQDSEAINAKLDYARIQFEREFHCA